MTVNGAVVPTTQPSMGARARSLYDEQLRSVFVRRDRVFAVLFAAQWLFAIAIAVFWSPYGWAGKVHTTHLHVYYAIIVGALLTVPPLLMIRAWPGTALTRHSVAVAQMCWSGLLIHLSGGRIETHFHVFASLAFLAFYRDWKVLVTATIVVAIEHLVRGLVWAESVYGLTNPEWWRFLEHAFWVAVENTVLVMGIVDSHREMRILAQRQAELEMVNRHIEARVIGRTQELSESREQYRLLLETTKTIPWEWRPSEQRFTYVGPQIQSLLGTGPESCLTSQFLSDHLAPDERDQVIAALGCPAESTLDLEIRMRTAADKWLWLRMIGGASTEAIGVQGQAGARIVRGVMLDVTQSREMEAQLRQSQKLESVGRLAAGVAHEINTPVQFVNDSVTFVRTASDDLGGLIARYRAANRSILDGAPRVELAREVVEAEEDVDLEYLLENVPKALDRSIEGLGRVATIVRSMKEFAHPDQKNKTAVNLNQAITSTLIMASNEYKYVADVETELGEIPLVACHAGEVNQAVLNIIVNAAHAVDDVVKGSSARGRIKIRTLRDGDCVVISISDTGGGIPLHIRDRIFDPFFTTKEVGKGTGQGLAIARQVVREKHGGDLTFESELGAGTTFHIRLPIGEAVKSAAAEEAAS
ncbi:MAG TPA: ATP-binding protein [Kofleriaceae bacterium]|nr:ATP-binding protein [Kofleriaceae bacterium]